MVPQAAELLKSTSLKSKLGRAPKSDIFTSQ